MSTFKDFEPPVFTTLTSAIRALAMDAVQKAGSGHPGMPMGMAEVAEVLWNHHLRHNPVNPGWPNRDRFVLSNGHGSLLLYALLHLTGYDLPMEELKRFRQLHSKTPGHPERDLTPGVETTTGPLGQGLANAVGMALAEKLLAQEFNRPGLELVDHRTRAPTSCERANACHKWLCASSKRLLNGPAVARNSELRGPPRRKMRDASMGLEFLAQVREKSFSTQSVVSGLSRSLDCVWAPVRYFGLWFEHSGRYSFRSSSPART